MAITFEIIVDNSQTNIIAHSDISTPTTRQLSISSILDNDGNADLVTDYQFHWYFIDKPTGSSSTISGSGNKSTITLNSIDTWGTYRLFCIAENPTTDQLSETNPLKAPETSFVNIRVQGPNYNLEKPAKGQRNWQDQYNTLIDAVENNMSNSNNNQGGSNTTLGVYDYEVYGSSFTNSQISPSLSSINNKFFLLDAAAWSNSVTDFNLPDISGITSSQLGTFFTIKVHTLGTGHQIRILPHGGQQIDFQSPISLTQAPSSITLVAGKIGNVAHWHIASSYLYP